LLTLRVIASTIDTFFTRPVASLAKTVVFGICV
jgi:hypothetical protein